MGEKTEDSSPRRCVMSPYIVVIMGLTFLACVVGIIAYFATVELSDCNCSTVQITDETTNEEKTDILVSTNWLHETSRTAGAKIRIVEVAVGKPEDEELFFQGHIPNAFYTTIKTCAIATELFPGNIPEPECLEEHLRSLGISEDTHVILYDRGNRIPSTREWWILRLHGHERVSILDGGLSKWIADGYETTITNMTAAATDYSITFIPARIRHMDAVMYNQKTKAELIVDARREEVYNGSVTSIGLKNGHIPGAKNIPFTELFNDDLTFKSPADIRNLAEKRGIDLKRPMVTMCRTGMKATILAVGLHLTGATNVPVYYGSWNQWSRLVDDEYIATGYN